MVYYVGNRADAKGRAVGMSHVFSGNPLDRGEAERRDDDRLARLAADPDSRFLPMRDLNVPVSTESHESEDAGAGLLWLSGDESEEARFTERAAPPGPAGRRGLLCGGRVERDGHGD